MRFLTCLSSKQGRISTRSSNCWNKTIFTQEPSRMIKKTTSSKSLLRKPDQSTLRTSRICIKRRKSANSATWFTLFLMMCMRVLLGNIRSLFRLLSLRISWALKMGVNKGWESLMRNSWSLSSLWSYWRSKALSQLCIKWVGHRKYHK